MHLEPAHAFRKEAVLVRLPQYSYPRLPKQRLGNTPVDHRRHRQLRSLPSCFHAYGVVKLLREVLMERLRDPGRVLMQWIGHERGQTNHRWPPFGKRHEPWHLLCTRQRFSSFAVCHRKHIPSELDDVAIKETLCTHPRWS